MDESLIKSAAKCLRVIDVYQRNTNVELYENYDPVSESQEVSIQYRVLPVDVEVITLGPPEDESGSESQLVRYKTECGIRLLGSNSGDDGEEEYLCEISAHFISDYAVISSLPDHEAMEEFGVYNVPYHVWPYLREYLHSTCMRCRLPVVTLPMYRVPENNKSAADKKSTKKKAKKKMKAAS